MDSESVANSSDLVSVPVGAISDGDADTVDESLPVPDPPPPAPESDCDPVSRSVADSDGETRATVPVTIESLSDADNVASDDGEGSVSDAKLAVSSGDGLAVNDSLPELEPLADTLREIETVTDSENELETL
jgi:hypothetical protein